MLRYSLKVEKDLTVFSLTFLVQDRSNNGVGNDRFEYWNTKFSSQDTYWFRSVQCFPGIDFKVFSYHK
jgi:hypothetical protein